jgi:hypothetical protein
MPIGVSAKPRQSQRHDRLCARDKSNGSRLARVHLNRLHSHHGPFQYYESTRNPTHARPSSVAAIGHSNVPGTNARDPANHQYDHNDFFAAMKARNLTAVSFLKAATVEDGHAGYSDPLDEQHFLVRVINNIKTCLASHPASVRREPRYGKAIPHSAP